MWISSESGSPPLSHASTCDVLEKWVMMESRLAPLGTPGPCYLPQKFNDLAKICWGSAFGADPHSAHPLTSMKVHAT